MVQVAVPSRTGMGAYQGLRETVDALVGRINGRFATPNWSPVRYLARGLSPREVTALYRAADVLVVTPIRDGMNLVAKEFIAARSDADGVLVLSEFTGAAAELAEALLVNPYDLEGTAEALWRALQMPSEERRIRMTALRARVETYDVHRWAREFLDLLGSDLGPPHGSAPRRSPRSPRPRRGSGRRPPRRCSSTTTGRWWSSRARRTSRCPMAPCSPCSRRSPAATWSTW
jgi:trehalose 6-phosphate synthase/phosphatase